MKESTSKREGGGRRKILYNACIMLVTCHVSFHVSVTRTRIV